ncbi:MAG: glycogen/starch synthase [Bacteroidetes bacterium]|nr:glycogen/starch synthase [Bacteroidota bacterium]
MENQRILLVGQEMLPYLEESSMARTLRYLAPYLQGKKSEIRLLMPRFGNINEKRHRLHEVVRLSGINIIINEDDNPMIIKVASLPDARIQVYFLDNEDLFSRKSVFRDENNDFYADNDLRMIFFCKGVLETVKKLGWAPDIVHCHGWMTSLIPLYLKKVYNNEPVFDNAKVIYSIYENAFSEKMNSNFLEKAKIDDSVLDEDLDAFKDGSFISLNKGAIQRSDGVIIGNENIEPELKTFTAKLKDQPVLKYQNENDYLAAYYDFYKQVSNN